MTIGTRLFTWLRGEQVGSDAFGNRYYRERRKPPARALEAGKRRVSLARERRWVLYAGEAEGSKVPPVWHAWLHHTIQDLPTEEAIQGYAWQKPHLPNLTGTPLAYRPPGSLLAEGKRPKATGDYEPWQPS
jgi:NADH:ubiquinone oxidoreductase subunit